MPRSIARVALLICEKLFDIVIIQGTHAVPLRSPSLAVTRREYNAPTGCLMPVTLADNPVIWSPAIRRLSKL